MTTPKRERVRLARAELLVHLATTLERWRGDLLREGNQNGALPPDEWPADDPFVSLARTYGLSWKDLARICDGLGDDLERRAIRTGYDDHWDDPRGERRPTGT